MGQPTSRRTREPLVAALVAFAGVLGVALTQPVLAKTLHDSKAKEDVYVLPPPAQLRAATLGHHAAAVDMLWAKMLVEYGNHMVERRAFPDVTRYLDSILALEPDYAPVYKFADTIIVYNKPEGGTAEDARVARSYLERGTRERPGDANVWLHYAQFLAFISPSFLPNGPEQDQWRKDGAFALMKAVDLGADADRSLSAATLLARYGDKDAAIRSLQRAYALTDDPIAQEDIANKLTLLQASAARDMAVDDSRAIESEWRDHLPFVSRGTYLLLGPTRYPAACAGLSRMGGARVRTCSKEWGEVLPSAHSL